MEDRAKADPGDGRGVRDDDRQPDQVAPQNGHDLGQQILDRAPVLGRQQPDRSGGEARPRDHEIGHQDEGQERAEDHRGRQPDALRPRAPRPTAPSAPRPAPAPACRACSPAPSRVTPLPPISSPKKCRRISGALATRCATLRAAVAPIPYADGAQDRQNQHIERRRHRPARDPEATLQTLDQRVEHKGHRHREDKRQQRDADLVEQHRQHRQHRRDRPAADTRAARARGARRRPCRNPALWLGRHPDRSAHDLGAEGLRWKSYVRPFQVTPAPRRRSQLWQARRKAAV